MGNRSIRGEPRKMSDKVSLNIKNFYEDDTNSRLLPGAKDYVSISTAEGRIHVQKRLVLCNLKELYQKWVELNNDSTDMPKIGFSSFALQCPKNCVLAGAAGTHSVCVCIYHQNPKLMVDALGVPQLSCGSLMGMAVCSTESENCMMHKCAECPGREALFKKLEEITSDSGDYGEEIEYKQWISTDRCTLTTVKDSLDTFKNKLAECIWKLTVHHFVAKSQSDYLSKLKKELTHKEVIVQLDFAENYTFIIQDEVQSSYFNSKQATLHPLVVYSSNSAQAKCYSIISDCLNHDTTTVHTFLSRFIPMLLEDFPGTTKVHYFSDGAASQYKNKYVIFFNWTTALDKSIL